MTTCLFMRGNQSSHPPPRAVRGTYKVCPDNFRKIAIKKKQLELRHFVFLAFDNMAASDLNTLQATLSLPPERLGESRRRAISRTPLPALLGGLLSENEAGQLVLRPRLPLIE
jgi:hypothetical protein